MIKSILSFTLILCLIAGMCLIALNGLDLGPVQIASVMDEQNGIRRGLDLVGGSVITFEAQAPEGMDAATINYNMDVAVEMLRDRMNSLGDYEGNLYRTGDTRITVEIPEIKNPEEAVQRLGSTAVLQFVILDPEDPANGQGIVVMDGSDVKSATAEFGEVSGSPLPQNYVRLNLKSESVTKFAEVTKALAARPEGQNVMMIVLDGDIKSAPRVGTEYLETGIASDTVQITGGFDAETAGWLANVISVGQLPFSLKDVELRSVGPQLGERALAASIQAGLIGLALVILFMIFYYRVPGLVSAMALVFYTALVAIVLSAIKINLSLPGIAGIVLSIGMAVDANVIIFERLKEELKAGKTLKSAVNSGFHRAFGAILDSNITTLIAAVVLYIFGTGTIKGFAITFGIGIVLSMFTAIVVTRFLLNRIIDFKLTNLKAYGA